VEVALQSWLPWGGLPPGTAHAQSVRRAPVLMRGNIFQGHAIGMSIWSACDGAGLPGRRSVDAGCWMGSRPVEGEWVQTAGPTTGRPVAGRGCVRLDLVGAAGEARTEAHLGGRRNPARGCDRVRPTNAHPDATVLRDGLSVPQGQLHPEQHPSARTARCASARERALFIACAPAAIPGGPNLESHLGRDRDRGPRQCCRRQHPVPPSSWA
jgi:hypothetical protein